LVSNIIELIFDSLDTRVVNVYSLFVVVRVFIKSSEDISPLSNESLSLRRSLEFSIEFLEVIDLLGVSPFLERASEVSHWLRVLDSFPSMLNIVEFLFDITLVMNLNLEHVHFLLPLLWNALNRKSMEMVCLCTTWVVGKIL